MSAPLYNRYRRYADREARRFPKAASLRRIIPLWKRPDTTLYSMSENAAYEAGCWSREGPGEMLRGMSLQYLPTSRVWIEWDWRAMTAGSQGRPITSPETELLAMTNEGVRPYEQDTIPVRVGAMIHQVDRSGLLNHKGWHDADLPPGTFMGLLTYVYPSGTFLLGPTLSFWNPDHDLLPLRQSILPDGEPNTEAKRDILRTAGVGSHYIAKMGEQNPRLCDRLRNRMNMVVIGKTKDASAYGEVQGTARLTMAALMACLSAKRTQYVPDPEHETRKRKSGTSGSRPVVEVDLFLRHRTRPGASLKASVGHMEGVKKGLHHVGAHYAYRRRSDNGDPRECPKHPDGYHSFEGLPDTKSEVCVLCGQKRWFKDSHKRGDEAYGVVGRKVQNVRVGGVIQRE